ncbi:MAG TPA: hypothetical protein VHQ48_12955 [Bradyrhizobium sp.]|jgi:hypothetical protein|nr:hypothetical protein [Bradyrhizobium sp.]
MRVLTAATILFLSSSLVPSFAQDEGKSPAPSQPQTVPVQPERNPQQSEQSREQDRQRAEGTRIERDWRAERRDGDYRGQMGKNDMGRMREGTGRYMDEDNRTVGRNWQMHPGDERADRGGYDRSYRGYYDEDRSRRRVKICVEYEDGDEYCHYR